MTSRGPVARLGRASDEPGVVVGVGIAPPALGYSFGGDEALRRAAHEELLDELSLHATLVFSSPRELTEFRDAIRALPAALAKRWETLLSSRRLVVDTLDPEAAPSVSEALDPVELEEAVSGPVRLVLLERDQAALLGGAHRCVRRDGPGWTSGDRPACHGHPHAGPAAGLSAAH